MNDNTMTICYSTDGECFNLLDVGYVFEELIDRDGSLDAGAVYYEADCRRMAARNVITADIVMEHMSDALWDELGEIADGYPEVTAGAKAELDTLLHEWVEKYCSPSHYWVIVGKPRERRVTQYDIERHENTAPDDSGRTG